jgi:hypothetical protein
MYPNSLFLSLCFISWQYLIYFFFIKLKLNLEKSISVKLVWTEPHWDQLFSSEETCIQFIQVKLTKIFYIESWFKVRLIHDSGLFRVWLRQVSLYIYNIFSLSDNIIFICMSFRNENKSKLLVSTKVSSPFDYWDIGPVFIGTFAI